MNIFASPSDYRRPRIVRPNMASRGDATTRLRPATGFTEGAPSMGRVGQRPAVGEFDGPVGTVGIPDAGAAGSARQLPETRSLPGIGLGCGRQGQQPAKHEGEAGWFYSLWVKYPGACSGLDGWEAEGWRVGISTSRITYLC
jgi:hypothetical protein